MTIVTWIIIIAALLLAFPLLVIPLIVYRILLVRTSPEKWGRTCSMPDDEECVRMHETGMQWAEKKEDRKKEVSVTVDGLKLCGQYFDLGYKKAAVIIAGRMESCLYSYYFAEPFEKAGCNILVIDNRAHGWSEGRYSCLGFREYRDILKWCELLHDSFGNEEILLHGICIGSSTALFALTDKDCPAYIRGMAAEGMYINFFESLKNHMIEQKRPIYPFVYVIAFWTWVFSSARIISDGPLKRIGRLKKPILFLHSREDIYSVPEYAEKLYERCTSDKQIVWFPTAKHSRIRINHTEKYDAAVTAFAERVLG